MLKHLVGLWILGLVALTPQAMAAGILNGIQQLELSGVGSVNCGSTNSSLSTPERLNKCQSCLTSAEAALKTAGYTILTTTACAVQYLSPTGPVTPFVSGSLTFAR